MEGNTKFFTENLAIGLLNTDKPLVYAILNTDKYDVVGYVFVAGDDSDCLKDFGCIDEDIERADKMSVGETVSSTYFEKGAVLIVKMKDKRH